MPTRRKGAISAGGSYMDPHSYGAKVFWKCERCPEVFLDKNDCLRHEMRHDFAKQQKLIGRRHGVGSSELLVERLERTQGASPRGLVGPVKHGLRPRRKMLPSSQARVCQACGRTFPTLAMMVGHYRKRHPGYGY